jgi:hypothetical protein
MDKIVAKNAIKRRAGYLYYVDGEGNVREARIDKIGKKKVAKKKATKKISIPTDHSLK